MRAEIEGGKRHRAIAIGGLLGLGVLAAPGEAAAAECTQKKADLTAGQTLSVGNVNVCNDAETLTVTYEATYPWCLVETNLQVATDLSGIPRNPQGHPTPGRFEDGDRHDCVGTATFAISLDEIGAGVEPGESVVIAAHAVVNDERQEGAWVGRDRFVERGPWATYFFDTTIEEVDTCGEDSRRVFVTSTIILGDEVGTGLAAADAICNAHATAANLRGPGQYKAWLSDEFDSPSTRLSQDDTPYRRVDGTLIADNWTHLTKGSIRAPINLTATGGAASGSVWTSTRPDGTGVGQDHCNNWTLSDAILEPGVRAVDGFTNLIGPTWLEGALVGSGEPAGFYCFQQPPP